MYLRRERWAQQPQFWAGIDPQLSAGLRLLFHPGLARFSLAAVDAERWTANSGSVFERTQYGAALTQSAASHYYEFGGAGLNTAGPISVLAVFYSTAVAQVQQILARTNEETSYWRQNWKLGFQASGSAIWGSDADGYADYVATGVLESNRLYSAVGTYGPSRRRALWLDGAFIGERVASGAPNTDRTQAVRIGAPVLGSVFGLRGGVLLAAAWTVALPDGAAQELSRNPWRLLQSSARRIYSLPTVSGIPTLSAATVTSITANSATPRVTLTF